MINILTISRAAWKIAVYINEQLLQNMIDSTAGRILQQFS